MHKSSVQKRLSLLIFCTDDIGSNIRLLSHAKSFSELDNSKVLILAPDKTSLPKQIEQKKNIKQQYFHQFFLFPSFLSFAFYPIQLLLYTLELFITAVTYPSFDYCLVSYGESYFLSFLLSKWCNSKLIFDYPSLKWSKNDDQFAFLRKIEEKILSFGDIHICSTKAIQLVLKVRNIDSIVIHDPNRSFFDNQLDVTLNNENRMNSKEKINDKENFKRKYENDNSIYKNFDEKRKESLKILGIKQTESKIFLCGVPFPFFENSILSNLLSIGDKLSQNNSSAFFILFTSQKDEMTIKKSIENHHFSSASASSMFKVVPLHSDVYQFILSCCDFGILFYPTIFGLEYSPQLSDFIQFNLPILAFKHGAICEAVNEGVNGFIFENEIELAKLLNRILIEKSVNLNKLRCFYSSSKFDQKWEIEWKKCIDSIIYNSK